MGEESECEEADTSSKSEREKCDMMKIYSRNTTTAHTLSLAVVVIPGSGVIIRLNHKSTAMIKLIKKNQFRFHSEINFAYSLATRRYVCEMCFSRYRRRR